MSPKTFSSNQSLPYKTFVSSLCTTSPRLSLQICRIPVICPSRGRARQAADKLAIIDFLLCRGDECYEHITRHFGTANEQMAKYALMIAFMVIRNVVFFGVFSHTGKDAWSNRDVRSDSPPHRRYHESFLFCADRASMDRL